MAKTPTTPKPASGKIPKPAKEVLITKDGRVFPNTYWSGTKRRRQS